MSSFKADVKGLAREGLGLRLWSLGFRVQGLGLGFRD